MHFLGLKKRRDILTEIILFSTFQTIVHESVQDEVQDHVERDHHERVHVQHEVQDQEVEPIQNLLQDPDLSIEDMIQDIRESDEDRISIPQNVQDQKPVQDQVRNHQEPTIRFIKREGDRIIIETTSPTSGKT